jgi:hypothetical protein
LSRSFFYSRFDPTLEVRATIPVMRGTARSVSGVTIRLTEERWLHITEEHAEVAGHLHDVLETIGDPEAVDAGGAGELLAVRRFGRLRPVSTSVWYVKSRKRPMAL